MKNTPLSIMPYYGGKNKMCSTIVELINYADTDIYIEPFGGAYTIGLNKPRHKLEFYNDFSEGLGVLIEQLANQTTARELIDMLQGLEYTEEEFNRQKEIRNSCDDCIVEQTWNKFVAYGTELFNKYSFDTGKRIYPSWVSNLFTLTCCIDISKIDSKKGKQKIVEAMGLVEKLYKNLTGAEKDSLYNLRQQFKIADEAYKQHDFLPSARTIGNGVSDLELAVATYAVYSMSRDGMGEVFSSSKFNSTEEYHINLKKLYAAADRLEGVQVKTLRATMVFNWLNSADVMMYCDPSYISPADEERTIRKYWKTNKDVLKAANIGEDNLSAILGYWVQQVLASGWENDGFAPKNLGDPYKKSFSYIEHLYFLKNICESKRKTIISNYDLMLYNLFLDEELGWKKIKFETTTSVGGKKDNKRTEVLWYNY